ncbi:hypothetical protein [Herbidospora sp. RD11066]
MDDYFSAATDDEAIAVIGRPSGVSPNDRVELKMIDPHVMMGSLESLLTGVPYEEISARPRHARLLRLHDDESEAVVTISDEFTSALAAATDDELRAVAGPWSETEEFWGHADPAELTGILMELRDLAVRTLEGGRRLYCWMLIP